MLERILVPLDGSLRSELILGQLGRLLRGSDPEVLLLRVVPPDIEPLGSPSSEQAKREREAAEKYIGGLAGQLQSRGARVKGRVIGGKIVPVILKAVEVEKVTLIAMMTHGRTGMRRWIMGSIAQKVIRQSPIPVLLARSFIPIPGELPREATAEELTFRRILVPTDGSSAAAAAVPPAKEIARLLGSEVVVVHAEFPVALPGPELATFPTPIPTPALEDPATESAAEAFADAGVRVTRLTEIGDPAGAILDQCQAAKADLIVMTTHGRSGAKRWLLGSVAERVLFHAEVPVLLVPVEESPTSAQSLSRAGDVTRASR